MRRVPFAVELRNVPFEAQKQIVFYVIDRLPRFVSGAFDHRGNGSYVAEVAMQRYGSTRIHLINATAAWYLDYFPKYRSGINEAAVLLPADSDLLDDHGDVELVARRAQSASGQTPQRSRRQAAPRRRCDRGRDDVVRLAPPGQRRSSSWRRTTREGVAMGNRFLDSEAAHRMDRSASAS